MNRHNTLAFLSFSYYITWYNYENEEAQMKSNNIPLFIEGSYGNLPIKEDDKEARKMAMLIDGICNGKGAIKAAKKYGYSKQRYYQVYDSYIKHGIDGLKNKKRFPKKKYVRTDEVNNQIIRHRFLDPDASAAVIAQKMKQSGYKVSQRSVERTITELGLQKKTPFVKSKEKENGS